MTSRHFPYYWLFMSPIHRWFEENTDGFSSQRTCNAEFWNIIECLNKQSNDRLNGTHNARGLRISRRHNVLPRWILSAVNIYAILFINSWQPWCENANDVIILISMKVIIIKTMTMHTTIATTTTTTTIIIIIIITIIIIIIIVVIRLSIHIFYIKQTIVRKVWDLRNPWFFSSEAVCNPHSHRVP